MENVAESLCVVLWLSICLLFCLLDTWSVCGRLDPPDLVKNKHNRWKLLVKIIFIKKNYLILYLYYWSMSVMVSEYSS